MFLGRAHWRHTVRISVQEHLAVIGPPRSFKTGLLTRLILSAPGAVVSTSSKPDLFNVTSGVRAVRGPVHVFNPQGIGGIPSTIRWSPVAGCIDPATAIRRADAFAAAAHSGGTDDGKFWDSTASGCLRALFMAADIIGDDMRTVARWANGEHTTGAIEILQNARCFQHAGALRILTGPAQKTAETVRAVINRALSFMGDPQLASSVLPGDEGGEFDIDAFLAGPEPGTLYMIAKAQGEDAAVSPVFAALANEIQWRATQLGSRMPGGRLDPPLRMVLDEVTQICPVPLPVWLADSGGQGVQVCTAFHGIAQLQERWGRYGAQTVMDTSSVRMFIGGLADEETLRHAATMCGQAGYRVPGDERYIQADVMAPDMVRAVPLGYALLIRGSFAPVIIRLARGWKDRAYKRARRGGYAIAQLTPTAMAPGLERAAAAILTNAGLGWGVEDPGPAGLPAHPATQPEPAFVWPPTGYGLPDSGDVAAEPEITPAYPWSRQ
jgi:type IV secretory pathway TraG/TraD family ATPase VirD4